MKLETFTGQRGAYKDWKRVLTAQRSLYQLQDKELAMLVYLSCKGDARQILNQLEMEEMTAEGGLQRMLSLLEEAYGSRADERFEERQEAYLQFRRSPGMPMSQYIASLKRLRQEYLREDAETVISDKAFAQRLLSRAGLTKKERMDCFFSAGGRYKAKDIERVLRFRCAKVHEEESRRPAASRANDESSASRSSGYKRSNRSGRYQYRGSTRYGRQVYHADDDLAYEDDEQEPGDADDEDLEEEVASGRIPEQAYYEDDYQDSWQDDYGGYGQDSYWQADGDWGYDDDDDEEDVPSATTQDISEAYAAGWRAKAQASGNKQSRGYRSKGSGKARVRGPDRRQVDDRKKRSVCSSCGNQGHWRGDPECPKVVAGEDSLHPRHQGAGGVSEVNVTFKSGPPSSPTSPSFSSPRNPGHKEPTSPTSSSLPVKVEEPPAKVTKTEPKPETKVTRVNWTMMVGNDHSPWELLQDYDSDEGDNSMASISDDEEPPALPPTSNASGSDKPPSKAEYKLALKTVLKALDYDDEVERHSKKKPGKEVNLRPGELLQALPHMDKAEKRELYKALKAEQETIAEETVQQAPPTSDKLKRANQRAGGYRATASSSSAPAAPTAAAPQEPQKDVPAAVRKKQLATFRRTLFENSLSRRGHVKPSQASEYPTAEQEACPHSFDDLRWGANNSAHWAHCKRCKLKRVLYYSMDHGAMMVGEDLQEVYNMGPSLSPGEVIVDTGCRTSVAGCAWHKMHQAAIRRLGLQFFEVGQEETFRFGAGPPILSRKAYLYPCFTHGQPTWLRISEVDGAAASCPGLVGPSEMARWSVELHFSDRTMVVFGEQRPMCLSVTRHPVLQLLEIQPHQADPSLWGTPDLQQQKHILKENPHQMAFLEGGSPDGHQSDPEESDHPDASEVPPETQEEETWDLTPANVGPEQLALMQEKLEYETSVTEVLMKDAFVASAAAPEDPYDSEGSISGGISETSHELGAPAETDSGSSTDEEVEERHGEFVFAPHKEPFSKGQRRKVTNAANQILLGFDCEKQAKREFHMAQEVKVPRPLKRRTGWKILEVFTWTCLLSRLADSWGWEFCEPITIPNWDLRQQSDIKAALDYVDRCDPDLLVIAWPCTRWSPMQNMNIKTEAQRQALAAGQLNERKTFLSFTRRAVLKPVLGENPHPSKAWKQPEIIDAFEGLPQAVMDQCMYGLKHPENGTPIQKATRWMGQEEVLTYLHTRCSGDHDHEVIQGNVRVGGRTVKLSEWCGGYSLPLCESIIRGAELYLQSDSRNATYYHNEVMAEELMMDGEEVQERAEEEEEEPDTNPEFQEPRMLPEDKQEKDIEDLLDEAVEDPESAAQQYAERHAQKDPPPAAPDHRRFQVAPEVRKAVEQAHRQLGHPSRNTLVRMLRLAGATDGAVEHAKLWRCDVCASRAPPKHPTAAAPGLRPYGFNRHHLVDLKYFRDSRRKLYVALSMLDAGTLFHQAVLLKTRRSEYCADKWHKHWLCIFGAPAKIRLDQGGEFESGFTALLENYSIPSTVTATQAAWQHSLAERHGGLLGIIMEAIILEHQVKASLI